MWMKAHPKYLSHGLEVQGIRGKDCTAAISLIRKCPFILMTYRPALRCMAALDDFHGLFLRVHLRGCQRPALNLSPTWNILPSYEAGWNYCRHASPAQRSTFARINSVTTIKVDRCIVKPNARNRFEKLGQNHQMSKATTKSRPPHCHQHAMPFFPLNLARLFESRYRNQWNDSRYLVVDPITRVLSGSLETLSNFEDVVHDDRVNSFVSLKLENGQLGL